jgi:soluble lytic murein transglycosylase
VLPGPGERHSFEPALDTGASLPSVSAPPPAPLAQQIAWVEGDFDGPKSLTPPPALHVRAGLADPSGAGTTLANNRAWQVRRAVQHLDERHTGLSRREIEEVAETIVDEAAAHGLDSALVLAVIHVESAGYNRAVSSVGALGLMQIMPATGEELAGEHGIAWHGPATLFDPIVNVKLGVAYLSELSNRYSHVPTALAAYNWGPGRIDQKIRRGAEVPGLYIEQVMRAYDRVESARLLARDASS